MRGYTFHGHVFLIVFAFRYQHLYRNPEVPEVPEMLSGVTHVEIKQQQNVKVHRKKEEHSKGSKSQVNEAASSSSHEPDWKMWGKTGPL